MAQGPAINAPDVVDRAGRLLGIVASITATVPADVSDRIGRLLGIVNSITNVVHVDDNAASLTVDAPVDTPLFARLSDGAAALVGQKVMASSLPVVLASDQASVPVVATPPTLTKGTQGATGFSTQDLKDSGRVTVMITAEFSPIAVAEALLTLSKSADGAAVSTGTSLVITSGKRFRITSWNVTTENTLGVNPKRNKLRLRFAATGGALVGSPLQANLISSVSTAVNTVGAEAAQSFPDGVEFLGNGTKAFGITNESPDWVTAAQTSKIYLTLTGFEY